MNRRRSGCSVAAVVLAMTLAGSAGRHAAAAEHQDCVPPALVLWGDGRHDDTKALNAWLQGRNAIWGDSGAPVGPAIVGRKFRLSSAIYVPGGTGRQLNDFRLFWPRRGETVSGGTIRAGSDPHQAPTASGVTIRGGDGGEGKPFEAPDPAPVHHDADESCATS